MPQTQPVIRTHLINRKIVTFAQDRRPMEHLSDIYEIASSKPTLQPIWLSLPIPFFPFQLSGGPGAYGPVFFLRWAKEKKNAVSFAVGTNRETDADL